MAGLLRGIVIMTTLALSVLLAFSLLNRIHPAFDSLSHFRLHIMAAVSVGILVSAAAGLRSTALTAGAAAAAAFAMSLPYVPGFGPGGAIADPSRSLRVVSFNVRFDNHETGLARDVIRSADPDIVILQEVTDTPASLMNLLRADYPVQLRCKGSAIGGAAVITRLPLDGEDSILCFETAFLSAIRLDVPGSDPLTVASYHAHWPWPHGQHDTIGNLSDILTKLPRPLLIGGDFNAAPWSEGVQRIARMTETRPVSGLRPSWLTPALPGRLKPYLGLPIDHLMVSREARVIEARTLPFAGSDHLPVFYRLLLKPPPATYSDKRAPHRPAERSS